MNPSPLRPTVLVVDDEVIIADTLAAILERHGYAASCAYSGEHAVQTARESMPDFLICDVILGGIDGVETAHRVLASCPDCRIVLIPGAPASAEIIQNRQANARRFEILGKPFHPALLIDVLTSIDSQREN